MVAGSVSGLRTENSIAQTSVSHVSLRGDDAPADSLHWLMSVLGQKQTLQFHDFLRRGLMNFAIFAETSLSRKAEATRFRGGPAAKLEQSADIAGGEDRGSK